MAKKGIFVYEGDHEILMKKKIEKKKKTIADVVHELME